MKIVTLFVLGVLAAVFAGCEDRTPTRPASPPPVAPPLSTPPLQPAHPAATEEPEPVREKAAVGMGEKGRGYGGGIVTTPIKTLWTVKEQITLDQIQHALQLFKATDPNGRGPNSHDEFMKRIIKENSIQLPQLPAGDRYYYDAEKEELMIEKPNTQ